MNKIKDVTVEMERMFTYFVLRIYLGAKIYKYSSPVVSMSGEREGMTTRRKGGENV